VEIPLFSIHLTQKQFHDSIKLVEYITKYSKFIMKREQKKQFLAHSPFCRSAKNLWIFAIDCVRKTLKSKKNRTVDYFALSERQIDYNKENFLIVHRCLKRGEEIDAESRKLYDRIIYISKMQDLYEWNAQVLTEIEQETRRSSERGWLRLLPFGWGRSKRLEDMIDPKEVEDPGSLPVSYVWLDFGFLLHSGCVSISKHKAANVDQQDTIACSFSQLATSVQMRIQGTDTRLSVNDLAVTYDDQTATVIMISKRPSQKQPAGLALLC
jgi:hypothetical protein